MRAGAPPGRRRRLAVTAPKNSGRGLHPGEGETYRAPSLALECAMHGTSMMDEVAARPRIAHEEFSGEHVCLEPIAGRACRDDVARRMRSTLRERMHMVERGVLVVERRGAIHAAPPAIAQRGELHRSLLLRGEEAPHTAHDAAGGA